MGFQNPGPLKLWAEQQSDGRGNHSNVLPSQESCPKTSTPECIMVWEAQVVAKGSGVRSRARAPTLHNRNTRKPAKERLYALRRRFVVVVDAEGIAVKVLGNFAPWWCAASPRQIIAKKRLVKIIDADGQTIMIRLAGEDKALEFAAAVRDEWGLEPLMHTAVVENDGLEDQRELENITSLFMASPEFRERVRQLHDCFGEFWNA